MCSQLDIKELGGDSFEYQRGTVTFILFVHVAIIELIVNFLFRSILRDAACPSGLRGGSGKSNIK